MLQFFVLKMLDNSEIEAILKDLHKDEDVSLIECVERSSKIIGENWDNNLVINYYDRDKKRF